MTLFQDHSELGLFLRILERQNPVLTTHQDTLCHTRPVRQDDLVEDRFIFIP